MTAKTLTIDIETAPLESYHWRLWDENISLDQIRVEWTVLSYCAKWLGKDRVLYADTGGRGVRKVRDDKGVLREIRELLDEADIVVAQNGNSFDIKKINARLLMQGFGPYSPIRCVDTKLAAQRYFGFTSNKLEWLAKHLTETPKSSHKEFPGFELWAEVLKDNPRAWAEMKRYNKADVVATENLYLRLRPWIADHPNMGIYSDVERPLCTHCGSDHVIVSKHRISRKQQSAYIQYVCRECGGYSRGKAMQTPLSKRRTMLAAA